MLKCILVNICLMSSLFADYISDYAITYGDPNASIKVRQYIAFDCDVCHHFYDKHFPKLKAHYIDKQRICWEFVPFVNDVNTLKAMICLKDLNLSQKKAFFELIFPRSAKLSDDQILFAMQKVMQAFERRVPKLDQRQELIDSKALQDSMQWRKEQSIGQIPSFEIDGQMIEGILSYEELSQLINDSIKRSYS